MAQSEINIVRCNSIKNCAIYCDVDGTLSRSNIVEPLFWIKKKMFPFPSNYIAILNLILWCPIWLVLDLCSRTQSNISIYHQYKNLPIEKVKNLAEQYYISVFKKKMFSKALSTLKEFKDNNYKIVLVSGGVDFLLKPLSKELNTDCIAVSLVELLGFFTGEIEGVPLTREIKANLLKQHADKNNVDLTASYALGDSFNDVQMMECVGHPIAVNPDFCLRKIARKKGWQIVYWKH